MLPTPPKSTLFPYTTLFRSAVLGGEATRRTCHRPRICPDPGLHRRNFSFKESRDSRFPESISYRDRHSNRVSGQLGIVWAGRDRKSTRLNSSHVEISYAVFC